MISACFYSHYCAILSELIDFIAVQFFRATSCSVLTGRSAERYDITRANVGHLRTGEITLAEALKKEGYTTGHFGKWHLGTLDPAFSTKGPSRKPYETTNIAHSNPRIVKQLTSQR